MVFAKDRTMCVRTLLEQVICSSQAEKSDELLNKNRFILRD